MPEQVVLITGALTNIGRATALAYARQGAKLVVSGRRGVEGETLEAQLSGMNVEAEFVPCDVRHESDVRLLVDKAVARFGRLDVAVNSAAYDGPAGSFNERTADTYVEVFATNVLGLIFSLKHEMRVMRAQGFGSIINVSSTNGRRHDSDASIHTATTRAVEALTKSAGLDGAARGVRVNAVAPGPMEAQMFGGHYGTKERKDGKVVALALKRIEMPEEIADTIVFLGSDEASFIGGRIVEVKSGKPAPRWPRGTTTVI
jgi:NAD(P)-dependent dehydrogenase (short-subunit alcohol dehydrogenase family)